MVQDLRFAVRLIARDPWFAATAVFVLALGIGINAMVFTLTYGVLFRGLPFPEADRLLTVSPLSQRGPVPASYPELLDWRAQSRAFMALAAYSERSFNLSDDNGLPERIEGARLTANAFAVLRQPALLGRDFGPDDEKPGAEPVVILAHAIWQNRYGSDPGVIGRTIRLDGGPTTVIGVMPPGMHFPANADLWTPLPPAPEQPRERAARMLTVFGRLAQGVSRAEAQTEMNGIAGRLAAEYPKAYESLNGMVVQTFVERFNEGPVAVVFLSMLGAVGFVLLIACANVANLQLARSIERAREIAVRVAIGASRARIVRQLLVESVLLGLLAGVIGLALTVVGVRIFEAAIADTGKPYWIVFTIDYTVFAYLAGLCVLAGILFGLAPALHVSRANINGILKEGGRGSIGGRRERWFGQAMVVLEVALTIVLLAGAGLMIRSFLQMYTSDPGFRTEGLMGMRLQLAGEKYQTPEARQLFFERLEPSLGALPGAEASALATTVPPFAAARTAFEIDGRPAEGAGTTGLQTSRVSISPRFFEVIGVSILRGRGFHALDGTPGLETAIVNERFASLYFPGEDPIGRRIRFAGGPAGEGTGQPWRTIVGVSPTLRHNRPQEAEPQPVVYVPFRQQLEPSVMLLVRASGDPGSIMQSARRAVHAVDRDQPVLEMQTLDQMLSFSMWPYRIFGSLFAIFAAIGLLLSAVGLYGVMACTVSQRVPEIGIRMALGAAAADVSWLFLRRGLIQLTVGVGLGLGGALLLSGALESVLVRVAPRDPLTFVAITVVLLVVGIAACVIPARRATRVDPLVALRAE